MTPTADSPRAPVRWASLRATPTMRSAMSRSASTTSATPTRGTTLSRYDDMGRVTAQLDAVNSALITAGMTQAQIDAVWTRYAHKTTYDFAGNRTSVTDSLGNITRYFYDLDERLRYVVDPLHYVREMRYDAAGNVTKTIAYASPIDVSGVDMGGAGDAGIDVRGGRRGPAGRAAVEQRAAGQLRARRQTAPRHSCSARSRRATPSQLSSVSGRHRRPTATSSTAGCTQATARTPAASTARRRLSPMHGRRWRSPSTSPAAPPPSTSIFTVTAMEHRRSEIRCSTTTCT